MKKFYQRQKRENKSAKLRNTKIVAAICAVIVLHFVAQFAFFRDDMSALQAEIVNRPLPEIKLENREKLAESKAEEKITLTDNKPPVVEAEEEETVKERKNVEVADAQRSTVKSEPKSTRQQTATRVVIRKKEPQQQRESKAERLRRAERILTGV